MGSGIGNTLKDLVTFGASSQNRAQKEAMEVQEKYQQQALLQQQLAYMSQMQNYNETAQFYEQQNAIQERELAAQEQQNELLNKLDVTEVKRQTSDKNSSDLTKGNVESAKTIKAELKGEEDEDELIDNWY